MLDLLFLSAAKVVLQTADADVGEQCQCRWRTVESTVEDGSKRCRSVGGDDLVRDERV
jgi:hypothetical protein